MAKNYERLREEIRGHLRFAVVAWMIALPLMYPLLIWGKFAGAFPNIGWVGVALLPIGLGALFLGGMWLAAASDLARAGNRQDPH